MTGGYSQRLGRLPPWLDVGKKSEQKIAVTGERTVFAVRIFLADEARFFEVLDGSPGGFLRDAEISGYPFYAGPCLAHHIPAVIQIDVDELRPVGKLVVLIQLFKIRQSDHLLKLSCGRVCCVFEKFLHHSKLLHRELREAVVPDGCLGTPCPPLLGSYPCLRSKRFL